MSTLENLFVQIFERKNRIIDQVKQQKDSYEQHLASKLLINGINPPSWLWNGFDAGVADLKELKREVLISGLLYLPPQSTIPSSSGHCTFYSKPVVTTNAEQLSDSLFTETCASNKFFDLGDKLTGVPKCHINDIEPVLQGVPELDPTATSPQDQMDARLVEPAQSLARIQRSRSRQKALELRNSAKAKPDKQQSRENRTSAYSSRITKSRTACQEPNHVLLELNKASDIPDESCGGVAQSKMKKRPRVVDGTSGHSGRITRSRISCLQPECVKELLKQDSSFDVSDKGGGRITRSRSISQEINSIGKSLQLSQPLKCVEADADFQYAMGIQTTIQKSTSREKDLEALNFMEMNTEKHPSKEVATDEYVGRNIRFDTSPQQLNWVERLLKSDNSSNVPNGKLTWPRSTSSSESFQPEKASNLIERNDLQRVSGSQVNAQPSNNDTVDERCTVGAAETELILNVPNEACYICSGSKMIGASVRLGLECLVSRPPSDNSKLVEPKQLVFDDVAVCSLNEIPSPSEIEKGDDSSEIRMFDSLGHNELPKEVSISNDLTGKRDSSADKQLLEKEQVMVDVNRDIETSKAFPEAEPEERLEFEVEESNCGSYPTSSAMQTSNLFAVSSSKTTSEICEDIVADTSPESTKIRKQSSFLQGSGKSLIRTELQNDLHHLPDGPLKIFGEKCNEELDVGPAKVVPEDCGLETCACDGLKKSTNHNFNNGSRFSLIRKPVMLSGAQETKFSCVVAPDATNTNVLRKAVTPDSALIHNAPREDCYYLRSSTSHDKNVGCSKSSRSRIAKKSVQLTKTINDASGTWPQCKQRTILQSTSMCATTPRLRRVKSFHEIHEKSVCRHLRSIENGSEAVLEFQQCPISCQVEVSQSYTIDSPGVGMHQSEKCHEIERFESSPKSQAEKGKLDLERRDQDVVTLLTSRNSQAEDSLDSSVKESNGDFKGYLKGEVQMADTTHAVLDINKQCSSEDNQTRLYLEGLNGKHCLFSDYSVRSPNNKNFDLSSACQIIPDFERFAVGVPTENRQSCIAGEGIGFYNSDLTGNTIESVSVLEQPLRTASMQTPLPLFSMTFELPMTPNIFHSLPNGLLEQMHLRNTLLFNDNDSKQLKASYSCTSEEVDPFFIGRSYSDCLPSSSVRFGCDARRPDTPPVGKLCQRIASNSTGGSSEKQESTNPELICFRIEEDPSTSEDNGNIDEVVDPLQEGISARKKNNSTNRRQLVDMTAEYFTRAASVSAAEKFLDRGSLDSVNMESNLPGKQMGVKQKLGNGYGGESNFKKKDKENQNSSLQGNGVWKASESLHSRFSKPKLSGKASKRKGCQSFLDKGGKRNNIVSNISSFIPLVQQKQQAAALVTGKRDIKVKALEAAETAKRLEEKRENERKLKKEAAKLERARLGQENMKQLELKQKMKEEEQKKKADIAAKKRLREEEERKENERKRKCIEEARRQQREHKEKLRAGKEEKDVQRRATEEREHKGKELIDEARKHQKLEKEREETESRNKVETILRTAKVSAEDARKAIGVHEDCDAFKNSCDIEMVVENLEKTIEVGLSVKKGSQEPSYEISPYQGSDDEEEEEDDIPSRKFIPSWAREKYLASNSWQKIDPDEIFFPESFCSIAEVLLPRKQQLK